MTDTEKLLKVLQETDPSVAMLEDCEEVSMLCSTGSIGLDWAIGIGGYPAGRVVEMFGKESTAKTTMALHGISVAQQNALLCAYIDVEHALSLEYAKRLGVDPKTLITSKPASGEDALRLVEEMASGGVKFIVVDSVAALVPNSEKEGLIGDFGIGKVARLMSQAMRVLVPILDETGATILFINQIRMQAVQFGHGNPEYTPGGLAMRFYPSVRIELKYRERIKRGDEPIGSLIKAKVVKNKVGDPQREVELEMMYGTGISRSGELLSLGEQFGLVKDKKFGDISLGRSPRLFLEKNPEVAAKLEAQIRVYN